MDKPLKDLCDHLKKMIAQLKPHQNPVSFLLLIGKTAQGKSTLLRQSGLEESCFGNEEDPKVYYNAQGIVLELDENWLSKRDSLLKDTIKQLNHCYKGFKISGLLFCVDVNELLIADMEQREQQMQAHSLWFKRFGRNIGYPIATSFIITKMDALAGFSEFYQNEHATELAKPLGFSVQKKENYRAHFNAFLETITQQVIHKMHPARSTIRRTLIREFPLQLNSLRIPLEMLIKALPTPLFKLQTIYFTSAEQGGVSVDRLNKKIQHEYALVVQDTFPQAINYCAYFIEGAIKVSQKQNAQMIKPANTRSKFLMGSLSSVTCILLAYFGLNHYKSQQILSVVNKELSIYDTLQQNQNPTEALTHLIKAREHIDAFSYSIFQLSHVKELKSQLQKSTKIKLQQSFFPALVQTLETVLSDPNQTPVARYKALKIYLMLNQPEHFKASEVKDWFAKVWASEESEQLQKKVALLNQTLKQPFATVTIKTQLVRDVRNYINALPLNYFYYALAKESFPNQSQPLTIKGFKLTKDAVPFYLTKLGFEEVHALLPDLTRQLQNENWVLERQDLALLQSLLFQSYSAEYIAWWKNFLRHTTLNQFHTAQEGHALLKMVQKSHSLENLIGLLQENTRLDFNTEDVTFNNAIGNIFTDVNLIGQMSLRELSLTLHELDKFLATLSAVHDGGRTAFNVTKSRFIGNNSMDPIHLLYNQSRQLPEPIASWTKQLADDSWALLIKETRTYLNQQWRETIYQDYVINIERRYPLDNTQDREINLAHFNRFFSPQGSLNAFIIDYLKPFLNTTNAQWEPKNVNGYALPISAEMLDEVMRANVISSMFFPDQSGEAIINFSLQKVSLDPIIASLELNIGNMTLTDTQKTESFVRFNWPKEGIAKLSLKAIDGNRYELVEQGPWALFKLLEKVNILVDNEDSSSLQILFEVNSNSGRYILKTANKLNAFTPGILNGFKLSEVLV